MATINGTGFNDNNTTQFNGAFFEFFPQLDGTNADDTIFGFNGSDILFGFNGTDILDGGAGDDIMDGGDHDDIYIVDNLNDKAAELFDDALGGVDIVHSTVTHELGFGIENLNLTGGGAIDGTGNDLNNIIDGTAAVNRMDGGSGNDTLLGFGGHDTLLGSGGNDTLTGGVGRDILNGGTFDADTFRYTAIGESTVGVNHDTIAGFNGVGAAAGDRVNVNAIDANTTVGGNQNFIFGGPFSIGHIRVINSGANSLIQGNVDNDPAAEFEIQVQDGGAVAANYVAGDFFL